MKVIIDEPIFKAGEYNDAIKVYHEEQIKLGNPLIRAHILKLHDFKEDWSMEMEKYIKASKQYFDL